MTHREIIGLMTGTTAFTKKTLSHLSDCINKYPYFQTAQLLHTINLLQLQDSYFLIDLRKTSVYVPDRKRLFFLINDKFFMQEQINAMEKETSAAVVEEKILTVEKIQPAVNEEENSVLEEEMQQVIKDDSPVLEEEAQPAVNEEEISVLEEEMQQIIEDDSLVLEEEAQPVVEEESTIIIEEESTIIIEKELPVVSTDYVSTFLSDVDVDVEVPPLQYQETIDKFLEKDAVLPVRVQLSKTDKNKTDNELVDSIIEVKIEGDFFSETLAKIYIKQKNYGKALEIIRKLNLIYPEKSRYFADQIRFLEKLIINSNKNI